jgi:ubiquitin-conjugating enzyme E2 J1
MAPSPTLRRLLKETAELSPTAANPNPSFHAAPVSDSDLHEWHFTLLGPPSPSPYANGLYHGRITLPTQYPLKPPNFRFLTPSGRFETNREICLSISGFHEETWMPAWGVRTALTALRSFMAEKGSAGQVGGLEASKEVRERLAQESRRWKCSQCGGKTNQEIMDEWWEACRKQGVKVEESIGLESLPEGMNLEARDPNVKDKEKEVEDQKATPEPSRSSTAESTSTTPPVSVSPPPSNEQPSGNSSPYLLRSQHTLTVPDMPSPTASQVQLSSESRLTPAEAESATLAAQSRPMQMLHRPPIPVPDPPVREAMSLDTAIGAIVFLLAAMILKKVFYPAQGVRDDFYLGD